MAIAFTALATLLTLATCHSWATPSGAQETASVAVGDYWFCDPSYREGVCVTTIAAGDTVVWDSALASQPHTVVECGASCDAPTAQPIWDSGVIQGGATFSRTFPSPGSYLYYCDLHPTLMRGRIIVGAGTGTPGPSATATPSVGATATPGASASATPSAGATATPGASATATPSSGTPAPDALYDVRNGLAIERFATGLRLPVNLAVAPPGPPDANRPFLYVTELYDGVAAVTRDGRVSTYVDHLLNFDPLADIPGGGESGVDGILLDPATGDVLVSLVGFRDNRLENRVLRFLSSADGLHAEGQQVILDRFLSAPSHQVQALSYGPDGKLYVNVGEAMQPAQAQTPTSPLGKVLRVEPADGARPADNPFPDSLAFAIGFRNPFGAAWSPDGRLYVTDNAPPRVADLLVRVDRGGNYGWCCDFGRRALYAFDRSQVTSPTALVFDTEHVLSPPGETHLYVAVSGPTYARGTVKTGKKILDIRLDAAGDVASVTELLHYVGNGYSTVLGLSMAADGLYFTDLYGEAGFQATPLSGNIYRVFPAGTPLPTETRTPTQTPSPEPSSTPTATATPTSTMTPRPAGDVNCDGRRDSVDATLVLQLDAGLLAELPCSATGDVNHDGVTNLLDAALLLQEAAGLIALPQ